MKNLVKFRKILKLKQSEVAEKLNIPRTTYAGYEQGLNRPNIDILIKLADLFNVSIDSLVGHNAEIVDLRAVSKNQRIVFEKVLHNLTDEQIARLVGYIDNL